MREKFVVDKVRTRVFREIQYRSRFKPIKLRIRLIAFWVDVGGISLGFASRR